MAACATRGRGDSAWVGVLSGLGGDAWDAGPRSASELRDAATHLERATALCSAPAVKAEFTGDAALCRRRAAAL